MPKRRQGHCMNLVPETKVPECSHIKFAQKNGANSFGSFHYARILRNLLYLKWMQWNPIDQWPEAVARGFKKQCVFFPFDLICICRFPLFASWSNIFCIFIYLTKWIKHESVESSETCQSIVKYIERKMVTCQMPCRIFILSNKYEKQTKIEK